MNTVEFLGRYLVDGHLSCPQEVARKLRLKTNSVVKVRVIKELKSKLKEKKRFAGIWKDMKEEDFKKIVEIPELRKDYFMGRNLDL